MQFIINSRLFVSLTLACCSCCIQPKPLMADLPAVEAEAEPFEIMLKGAPQIVSLYEVPGSVSVLDAEELKAQSAVRFSDVAFAVPGLNYAGGSAAPRFFQIRGIGEFEQYEGAPNPSVGVVVDDIDFSGLGLPSTLFDIAQIEVLKGPQTNRYGASALAGVIRSESTSPGSLPSGVLELGAGNDSYASVGAAVGGSIFPGSDKLRARFSTSLNKQDGFRDNAYLQSDDTNSREERTSRLRVMAEPSNKTLLDFVLLDIDNNNGYDVFSIDNGLTTQSDRPGEDDLRAHAGSLRARVELEPGLTFESITTLLDATQSYSYDGDWGNNQFWEPYAPYDYEFQSERVRRTFSQELKVRSNPLAYAHGETPRWLAGTFYQRLNEETAIGEFADSFQYRDLDSEYRAKTNALFAEVEIPIQSGTALTIGGRAERRVSEYTDTRPSDLKPSDSMFGANISLTQDLNSAVRSYLTAARGFKGGGVNPGTLVPNEDRIYGPEYLWSFEAGIKGHFFDNALETELAAFYLKREDAQLKFAFQYDPSDPLAFTYVTSSAGEGDNVGLEGRAAYKISDSIKFFAQGSLLDTEYTDVPEANSALGGREQSHAPSWQYAVGAMYQPTDNWFMRVELQGKDDFYFDDSHDARSSAYELVNASIGYRTASWSWTIWGRNLLDEEYAVRGFFFGNEPPDFKPKEYVQLGDPVSFGTTVTIYF